MSTETSYVTASKPSGKELEARLEQAKADSKKTQAEARDKAEQKLAELHTLLSDGWNNVSESVAQRLNQWLR